MLVPGFVGSFIFLLGASIEGIRPRSGVRAHFQQAARPELPALSLRVVAEPASARYLEIELFPSNRKKAASRWLCGDTGNAVLRTTVLRLLCLGNKQTMDEREDAAPLSGGEHYREIARKLRGVARECHLPNVRQELLALAARYERRADHFDRRAP
jgi:hypothetical protein